MSIFLRFIEPPQAKLWIDLWDEIAGGQLPVWAVREFTPTFRDKDGVSVYEIEDDQEAHAIAGAFAISSKMDGVVHFLSADRKSIEAAGLRVSATAGNLQHAVADPRHRVLDLTDLESIAKAARCFASGELVVVNEKEVGAAVRGAARRNEINFHGFCHKRSLDNNPPARNLCRLIGEKVIEARGVG